jgi:hypothetical protein
MLASDVVPWICAPDWRGAVMPAQVFAVAGVWTILVTGMDAPLMAVGRPGALAAFNVVMMTAAGASAWFTAPICISAVAVSIAACQLVALLAGQIFLTCSAVLILTILPVADALRASPDPLALTLLSCSLGLAAYVCVRILSPSAWGDLRTLFVRVLRARRLLPTLRHSPQQA